MSILLTQVKPAMPYLDVIRLLRDNTSLPISAYQVRIPLHQRASQFSQCDMLWIYWGSPASCHDSHCIFIAILRNFRIGIPEYTWWLMYKTLNTSAGLRRVFHDQGRRCSRHAGWEESNTRVTFIHQASWCRCRPHLLCHPSCSISLCRADLNIRNSLPESGELPKVVRLGYGWRS